MTTTTIVVFRRLQGTNFVYYNYMDIIACESSSAQLSVVAGYLVATQLALK